MIPLHSRLESVENEYVQARAKLEEHQFALGGGWEYDRGSFDRFLDEGHKVWLRLPFRVLSGNLDGETDDNDARIRFGQPFVLKHLYREGTDPDVRTPAIGGTLNQFQDPENPDAEIEAEWIDKARQVLESVEPLFP